MTSVPDESMRGSLLVATPALTEPTFARTVILLLEHSAADGALGVVVNRPTQAPLADVVPAVEDGHAADVIGAETTTDGYDDSVLLAVADLQLLSTRV